MTASNDGEFPVIGLGCFYEDLPLGRKFQLENASQFPVTGVAVVPPPV